MPQYLLSVWHDEPYDEVDFTTPDAQRMVAQVDELNAELQRAGAWVFVAVLADAPAAEDTDWSQIVALYDQLFALRPNPVIALNRAVAIGEMRGAAAGLTALDALDALDATLLTDYQPYHAARADLLARAGQHDAALRTYDRAIELSTNPAERRFLERQRNAGDGRRRSL